MTKIFKWLARELEETPRYEFETTQTISADPEPTRVVYTPAPEDQAAVKRAILKQDLRRIREGILRHELALQHRAGYAANCRYRVTEKRPGWLGLKRVASKVDESSRRVQGLLDVLRRAEKSLQTQLEELA